MHGYLEAYVIWEGALDQERTFRAANTEYARWALRIIRDALKEGADVQVYSIYHDHSPDVEDCACVQYLTDHSPDYSTARLV